MYVPKREEKAKNIHMPWKNPRDAGTRCAPAPSFASWPSKASESFFFFKKKTSIERVLSLQKFRHASESSGEAYTANEAFATTRRRGKLPAPKIPEKRRADGDARDKVLQAVARDRDYAVDAMIVRIMKARKTLPHNRLLSELMTTLKHPAGAADIKKRIEILIEREYLERDLHDTQCYNYLA